jgi:hypothetical protein
MRTPGKWRPGKNGGEVVADSPLGAHDDACSHQHYGGNLICESVHPANQRFIAAAPSMFDELDVMQDAIRFFIEDGQTPPMNVLQMWHKRIVAVMREADPEYVRIYRTDEAPREILKVEFI